MSSGDDASQIVLTCESQDQATIEQVQGIEIEIQNAFPLLGKIENIETLLNDYSAEDDIYQNKLKDLFTRYEGLRRTRGDGSCFYRAFGFKLLETCMSDDERHKSFLKAAETTKDDLVKLGYTAYTVEDFYDTFVEVLNIAQKADNLHDVAQVYNDQSYSDYFVVFLRLIASCYLQINEEFYNAFLENYTTMKDFCKQEVEPMAKESDHIHIIALTNALATTVQVEYMDRSGTSVNKHHFPDDGSEASMTLLYRPGHYDILYDKINS